MNTKPTFQVSGITLFHADSLTLMDEMATDYPDDLYDMIFAAPPYFLSNDGISGHAGKMGSVNKGRWDKSMGVEANHEFNLEWLRKCRNLLKPNGTIWVSGTHHVIHSVGYVMQCLGMKILNSVTWEKPNPPPNLSRRYFPHSTETILWAARSDKSKHCFNYQAMHERNGGKQMKTVWRIGPPRKSEKKHGEHPTQKPVELLDRIVLASTNEGDWIFDPFAGSSTTGVSAIRNGRNFVGCEKEKEYADLSMKRIMDEHVAELKEIKKQSEYPNRSKDRKPQFFKYSVAVLLEDEESRELYLKEIAKLSNGELMDYARKDVEISRLVHDD